MNWEREFFFLAATVLKCRMEDANGHPDKFGCLLGEIDYSLEMHLVMREAGMLPRQRLARCAAGLFMRHGESNRSVPGGGLDLAMRGCPVARLRSRRAPSCERPS